MALHYIGTADEFTADQVKLVTVKGRSVGIYRLPGGQLHAVLNFCPHQGAELCAGPIASWVRSPKPGEFIFEKEREIVRCPWHGWEFDIPSGCLVVNHKVRTRSYEVTVEKFPLSVEKDKVYIEM